jgi:hypothetical protein
MKLLEIQNVTKAIGADLEGDWRVYDVMEWDKEYHFVCEAVKRVYDPNTFMEVTKSFKKVYKLEREEKGMGSYMLSQMHNDGFGGRSMGMPKEDVKDMKILLRYLIKMIHSL